MSNTTNDPGPTSGGRCATPQGSNTPIASHPSLPLPGVVSGRVTFYATRVNANGQPEREVTLGNVDETLPLASAYKTIVLYGVLKDVDSGRLSLKQTYLSTTANRSIEDYPAGRNSVLTLAQRAIHISDNTASDILHLAVTPQRVATLASSLDPCAHRRRPDADQTARLHVRLERHHPRRLQRRFR